MPGGGLVGTLAGMTSEDLTPEQARMAARERFNALVAAHQRRALRIAYQYLRDQADADEAVQDAFVKVFQHISTYREDLPFGREVHPHEHHPQAFACALVLGQGNLQICLADQPRLDETFPDFLPQ